MECEQAALPVCWHPGLQSSPSILPHSLSALPQSACGQTAHRRTCTSFSASTLLTLFSFSSALHLNSETPLTVNLVIYHSSCSHILLTFTELGSHDDGVWQVQNLQGGLVGWRPMENSGVAVQFQRLCIGRIPSCLGEVSLLFY